MENIATTLHTLLTHNIVSFTFRKVNGEIRHAVGTRNLALASRYTQTEIPTPKGEEQSNSYYDVEKMGWRSYKPENLISIDGCKIGWWSAETPKKGELPKREIPVVKPTDGGDLRKPDINAIIGGLFGGIGFGGDTDFIPTPTPKENRFNDGKIHTPVATERGFEIPVGGVPVEEFAKMVAHYVVDELVTRLTR